MSFWRRIDGQGSKFFRRFTIGAAKVPFEIRHFVAVAKQDVVRVFIGYSGAVTGRGSWADDTETKRHLVFEKASARSYVADGISQFRNQIGHVQSVRHVVGKINRQSEFPTFLKQIMEPDEEFRQSGFRKRGSVNVRGLGKNFGVDDFLDSSDIVFDLERF